MTDEPATLTLYEVADLLRISDSTAKRLAKQGKLPGNIGKVGRQWRFSREAVMNFVGGG